MVHADLQGMPMTLAVALTVCLSSKASSLIRGPIPACLLKSCRHSGVKSSTCTWAAFSSGLAAVARSGGRVTNVQTAFHTSGRLLFSTGHMGGAVPSAQAELFVSTTRLPQKHLKLRCFGMPRRTTHVTRPSDCQRPHEGPLEMQRLLARMAGFSVQQGVWQDWVS